MNNDIFLLFAVLATALIVGIYCYSIGYERGQRDRGDRKQ